MAAAPASSPVEFLLRRPLPRQRRRPPLAGAFFAPTGLSGAPLLRTLASLAADLLGMGTPPSQSQRRNLDALMRRLALLFALLDSLLLALADDGGAFSSSTPTPPASSSSTPTRAAPMDPGRQSFCWLPTVAGYFVLHADADSAASPSAFALPEPELVTNTGRLGILASPTGSGSGYVVAELQTILGDDHVGVGSVWAALGVGGGAAAPKL